MAADFAINVNALIVIGSILSLAYFLKWVRLTSSAQNTLPFSNWQKIVASFPSATSKGPVISSKGIAAQYFINSSSLGSLIVSVVSHKRLELFSLIFSHPWAGATGLDPLQRLFAPV